MVAVWPVMLHGEKQSHEPTHGDRMTSPLTMHEVLVQVRQATAKLQIGFQSGLATLYMNFSWLKLKYRARPQHTADT